MKLVQFSPNFDLTFAQMQCDGDFVSPQSCEII